MRMNQRATIENPRQYLPSTVDRLKELLASGVSGTPDPKRKNFYAVRKGVYEYFIFVPPGDETVILLAAWLSSTAPPISATIEKAV